MLELIYLLLIIKCFELHYQLCQISLHLNNITIMTVTKTCSFIQLFLIQKLLSQSKQGECFRHRAVGISDDWPHWYPLVSPPPPPASPRRAGCREPRPPRAWSGPHRLGTPRTPSHSSPTKEMSRQTLPPCSNGLSCHKGKKIMLVGKMP